jgi:tetratricopeptide (TPR) repeat protein/transcriptional regulator with XRE-family HTH domain
MLRSRARSGSYSRLPAHGESCHHVRAWVHAEQPEHAGRRVADGCRLDRTDHDIISASRVWQILRMERSVVTAGEDESLGGLLRRYRLAAGLTQEELAGRSGLSVRAISAIENGRTTSPYRRSVRLLADALALTGTDRVSLMGEVRDWLVNSVAPARTADGGLAAPAPGPPAAARPAEGTPAQLPADIREFTGRSVQLAWLADLLARTDPAGSVPIGVITGSGGMGKSALAIRAAHQLRGEFPDGQLFIDLCGSLDEPLGVASALARLLRHLGISDSAMAKDETELAAMYRTRLADRRMLIILDDARDAAQVRPLLPGTASSAVLVTSRNWLSGLAGSQLLALDGLDGAEARALFADICGADRTEAEPEATEAILTVCAGLPLAVRIVASRLVTRPGWNVSSLSERLTDERQRLGELQAGDLAVRACFQVSYAMLAQAGPAGDQAARAFRLLGLWSGPDISLPAAAALLGLDAGAAARAMEKLVDIHLLDTHAPSRYRFHDLIRVFAAECAGHDEAPASREQAVRRLVSWYLHTADGIRGNLGLVPRAPARDLVPAEAGVVPLTFADYDSAADWGTSELANLAAAVLLAGRWKLHRLCGQLGAVVWHGCLRLPADNWSGILATAVAAAERAGEPGTQAWLLNKFGVNLLSQGSSSDAVTRLEEALALSRAATDELCEAKVTAHLGIACRLLKRYDEAIAYAESALSATESLDPRHRGRSLSNLGLLYLEVGRLEEAAGRLEQSVVVSKESGDLSYVSQAHSGLADAYRRMGMLDMATRWAGAALEISRTSGDPHQEIVALIAFSEVMAEAGDTGQARSSLTGALALARGLRSAGSERSYIEAGLAALGG